MSAGGPLSDPHQLDQPQENDTDRLDRLIPDATKPHVSLRRRSAVLHTFSVILVLAVIATASTTGVNAIFTILYRDNLFPTLIVSIVSWLLTILAVTSGGLWAVGAFSNKYTQSVIGKKLFGITGLMTIIFTVIEVLQLRLAAIWPLVIMGSTLLVSTLFGLGFLIATGALKGRTTRGHISNQPTNSVVDFAARTHLLRNTVIAELRNDKRGRLDA